MSSPPTGTVTFLFTDIEGSTRLAQTYPAEWPALYARHHAILRAAIESHHGHVFQIVGDAFCAAFHTAPAALAAALAAQRALRRLTDDPVDVGRYGGGPQTASGRGGTAGVNEVQTSEVQHTSVSRQPSSVEFRVRMGLHTGATEFRDGEYHGYLTLARAQRIMSAGHGGQVLLSAALAELVRGDLPAGASLRDLGSQQLKSLNEPEHLFQLVTPDLPSDFPALASLTARPNNLPLQLTSFIGRERELAEVRRLLATTRLLTLTGSGGTGKTRLSLQVAAALLDAYGDGVWFVELAPLSDPALMPQTVASALGLREEGNRPIVESLSGYLRDKRLLLLLDNCEHLVDTCASLADRLLHVAPGLTILASSREALGIAGETAYPVPSLETPNPQSASSMTELRRYASVRLFAERAAAAKAGFTLNDANAPAVAQICARLDGIPLAIELAAARIKVFAPEQIAARLDDRFRLLTGGSRTALPRQQTLRALIDWSYSLLSELERILLRRLSVFAGGWTFEAAEAVCGDDGRWTTDDRRRTDDDGQQTTPSVRGDTADDGPPTKEVDKSQQLPSVVHRLSSTDVLDLLTHLVEKSLVISEEPAGEPRYRMLETVRQYAREKLFESGEGEVVRAIHLSYFVRWAESMVPRLSGGSEQLRWFDRWEREFDNVRAALDWALISRDGDQALQLVSASYAFWQRRGHWREGRRLAERVLASADRTTPNLVLARVLWQTGNFAGLEGDDAEAKALSEQSLAISAQLNVQSELPQALNVLYTSMASQVELLPLLAQYDDALALARQIGDNVAVPMLDISAAVLALRANELQRARQYAEDGLAAAARLGDRTFQPALRRLLGYSALRDGNWQFAAIQFAASLTGNREQKDMGGVVRCLCAFATLAAVTGDPVRAATLSGAFERQFQATGTFLTSLDGAEIERYMTSVRAALGPATFDAAFAAGQSLTLDQAIALALEQAQG